LRKQRKQRKQQQQQQQNNGNVQKISTTASEATGFTENSAKSRSKQQRRLWQGQRYRQEEDLAFHRTTKTVTPNSVTTNDNAAGRQLYEHHV